MWGIMPGLRPPGTITGRVTLASRIALVYPRANLDTVPSLVGAAQQLAAAGYVVDVFTYRRAGQPDPCFSEPGIRLRSLGVEGFAEHSTAALRGAVKRVGWLPNVARGPLIRTYNVLGAGLVGSSRLAARARGAVADRFACAIGVDPDGLVLAQEFGRGAPLVYYSLELLLSYELSTADERQLKAHERELSRQAVCVVVQDAERAQLMIDDNGLEPERVALVPNAPPGPARRKRNRYWHERFDLPSSARVVLHSGSLGDWTGIGDIVESVREWPQPWVLVVHTRYDAESSSYVDGLRSVAEPGRVFFSLKPLPRQDYDAVIDGAEVGIAFYVPKDGSAFTQRNVQTIGLSSGKLAYYLRAGLPVIVNRASSIAAEVDRHGLGVAVEDARQIGPALIHIGSGYDRYSAGAVRFFAERLDFGRAFQEVIDRIRAVAA
jgi:glycosyltransferase involved in cell wall biosynthesis